MDKQAYKKTTDKPICDIQPCCKTTILLYEKLGVFVSITAARTTKLSGGSCNFKYMRRVYSIKTFYSKAGKNFPKIVVFSLSE